MLVDETCNVARDLELFALVLILPLLLVLRRQLLVQQQGEVAQSVSPGHLQQLHVAFYNFTLMYNDFLKSLMDQDHDWIECPFILDIVCSSASLQR